MSTVRTSIARIRGIDLRVIDGVLAVMLTAGALIDAWADLHHGLDPLVIASCAALTGSVAWRRVNPVITTAAAITGYVAFVVVSGYDGTGLFEAAALLLNFYMLGRRTLGRESILVAAGLFVYWLAGSVVSSYVPPGGSVGVAIEAWVMGGVFPFAVGRTLATRSVLTRELEATAARVEAEQEMRARRAAAEERNRMARELHDVIAHSVSLMVVQTSGAQLVASRDIEAAREALEVVESAGREALVELRRIVGVLRRGSDQLAGSAAPGLSQIGALVERSRAAGLEVELHVEGRPVALAPGLDLVAYRVLQEALTNAIKHAGHARAQVTVSFRGRDVELAVSDTGHGTGTERHGGGSGHGLVGMGERVALYGGELHAGPRADGGFEVRARIPLEGTTTPLPRVPRQGEHSRIVVPVSDRLRWPWLDPLLAAVMLVIFEVAVLTASPRRGPVVLNMIVVAAMPLAAIWRRRSPLLFVVVTYVVAVVMNRALTPLSNSALPGIYFAVVPMYTLAVWTSRRIAVAGLAIVAAVAAIGLLIVQHVPVGTYAGEAFAFSAAWAAGRAIRARRRLTGELQRTSTRLEAERADRERLAVAGERSRIARELHAVVARSVATMVVQTEAAHSLLDRDLSQADRAMRAIEDTGRQALTEMRRILGVLRHRDEVGELAPQPGVDQIHTLIQRAREGGQPVELTVDGEPGTIPAGVDLGIYRILEEALRAARQQPQSPIGVTLRFGEEDLELHLTAHCHGPSGWPTDAMRERVALCGGELAADPCDKDDWRFAARMPRGLQGVLA